jgi:MoaA/NifB/PqqE/SkfB family radical SAM enzyme
MKDSFWKRLFSRQPGKPFSAWQIELTTGCPLRCRMCCREGHPHVPRQDMVFEDFRKLAPSFRDVEAVILEGWGESLLHPQLIPCIGLVRGAGSRVGFVTSGRTLNEAYIKDLVEAGPDFMGFSLSGATPQTHNAIRVHSDLDELTGHIRLIQETKARLGRTTPRLHIVYLLLRENIHEVPRLVALARSLNIEEVALIQLGLVTTAWQEENKVFGAAPNPEFERYLNEGERLAREWRIRLVRPAMTPCDPAVCAENPLRNLYISVQGDVSPCVYLNPPLPRPYTHYFRGAVYPAEQVTFGNIFTEGFEKIWAGKAYVEFRERFALRKRRYRDFDGLLIDLDQMKQAAEDPIPAPPTPCQRCYKMLGY